LRKRGQKKTGIKIGKTTDITRRTHTMRKGKLERAWWPGSGLFSIPKLILQSGFRRSGIRCINNGPKGIKI